MEVCLKCGHYTMPRLQTGSVATAPACQNPTCGFIEELREPNAEQKQLG